MDTKERIIKINEITNKMLYTINYLLDNETIATKEIKDLAESYSILKKISWDEWQRMV